MPKARASTVKAEKTIGERIRQERTWRHITQEQLAALLNIKAVTISAYEKGRVIPPFEKLREIADVFKCPISNLYIDWRETV